MEPPSTDWLVKVDSSLAMTVPLAGRAVRFSMPNFAADAVPPTVRVAVGLFAVSVISPLAVFTVPVTPVRPWIAVCNCGERRNLTGAGAEGDGLRRAAADGDGQGLTLRHGALRQQIGRLERVRAGAEPDGGWRRRCRRR